MSTQKKTIRDWALVALQIALLLGIVVFVKLYDVPDKEHDASQSQATLRARRPIPQGARTYHMSGSFEGPTIIELTIDPLDTNAGQNQNISTKISDANPITSVQVVVTLDNESEATSAPLSLSEGTDTDGVWTGSVIFPDDTLETNYTVAIIATSLTGTSRVVTTIR